MRAVPSARGAAKLRREGRYRCWSLRRPGCSLPVPSRPCPGSAPPAPSRSGAQTRGRCAWWPPRAPSCQKRGGDRRAEAARHGNPHGRPEPHEPGGEEAKSRGDRARSREGRGGPGRLGPLTRARPPPLIPADRLGRPQAWPRPALPGTAPVSPCRVTDLIGSGQPIERRRGNETSEHWVVGESVKTRAPSGPMGAAGGRGQAGWAAPCGAEGRRAGIRHAHVQGEAAARRRGPAAGRAASQLHVPRAQPAPLRHAAGRSGGSARLSLAAGRRKRGAAPRPASRLPPFRRVPAPHRVPWAPRPLTCRPPLPALRTPLCPPRGAAWDWTGPGRAGSAAVCLEVEVFLSRRWRLQSRGAGSTQPAGNHERFRHSRRSSALTSSARTRGSSDTDLAFPRWRMRMRIAPLKAFRVGRAVHYVAPELSEPRRDFLSSRKKSTRRFKPLNPARRRSWNACMSWRAPWMGSQRWYRLLMLTSMWLTSFKMMSLLLWRQMERI